MHRFCRLGYALAALVLPATLPSQTTPPIRTSFEQVLEYVLLEDIPEVLLDLAGPRCFDFGLSGRLERELTAAAIRRAPTLKPSAIDPLIERIRASPCTVLAAADSATAVAESVNEGSRTPAEAAPATQPGNEPEGRTDQPFLDRRRGSLGMTTDVYFQNPSWNGGLQGGLRVSSKVDLLLQLRYTFNQNASLHAVGAEAEIYSLELGGRGWIFTDEYPLTMYAQGGGVGTVSRVRNDSEKAQYPVIGLTGSLGAGRFVVPGLMASLELHGQVLWSAGLGQEDDDVLLEEPEERATAILLRFGITSFW